MDKMGNAKELRERVMKCATQEGGPPPILDNQMSTDDMFQSLRSWHSVLIMAMKRTVSNEDVEEAGEETKFDVPNPSMVDKNQAQKKFSCPSPAKEDLKDLHPQEASEAKDDGFPVGGSKSNDNNSSSKSTRRRKKKPCKSLSADLVHLCFS